jgi:hypothetical protein
MMFMGCILNPKTLQPSFVYWSHDMDRVVITDHHGRRVGAGYYDTSGHSDYKTSEASGYPRAHTPDGVSVTGMGYGTVLYSGLSMGAMLASKGLTDFELDVDGEGISSNEHRSYSASKWWRSAKELGIAYEEEVEGDEQEEEVEEEFDVTLDPSDHRGLHQELLSALENEDIYPDTIEPINVTGSTLEIRETQGSSIADVLPCAPIPGLAKGAEPLILFATAQELTEGDATILGEEFRRDRSSPQVPKPMQLLHEIGSDTHLDFNEKLAHLLNVSDTNVFMQALIEQVYASAGAKRLFEKVSEESIGLPYGYLLENSKRTRKAQDFYQELDIKSYAELPDL